MSRFLVITVIFMLLGPIVPGLVYLIVFTLSGLSSMGAGAILAGAMYFFFWLPSLYLIYGVPFLLTGILCALAARAQRLSLLAAMLAGAIAFCLYLAARYLLFGTLAEADRIIGPGAWSGVGAVAGQVALGILPCWWLVRERPTRWV